MSRLATKKHGSGKFGTVSSNSKGGTPQEFGEILAEQIFNLKLNPKIGVVTLVAQGLGTIEAENGFDGSTWAGDGTHIGPFAMDPKYYGPPEKLMNKVEACRIALEHWKSDGETWVPGWWKWEEGETEGNGGKRAPKFHAIAVRAINSVLQKTMTGGAGNFGENIPLVGTAVHGVASAGDFLNELAETLLDFRKLGQLAVEATAWFLRLLLRALWDYVIAPIFHWTERAVIWYGDNFYGSGVEQGSGFGSQLRANAGVITIAFWAIGYGVLWTDGESMSPATGGAHNSMAGRAVKGVEGKIARRSLIKPSKVKEKTPDKPKPKASTVQIERAQTFSVGRKRPVSVTSTSKPQIELGRNKNASSEGHADEGQKTSSSVERPQKQIHLPRGVEPQKTKQKSTLKLAAKSRRTGVGA